MRIATALVAATFAAGLVTPVLAQSESKTPENTASPAKEADKMESGDKAGSLPNSSNPGANPGANGNANQDSRTTKTRDR